MARRKEAGHGGGHGWFVTFADLMGLLVSFFVMLVAFSTQDQAKLQVVAGSMRDAFGVQDRVRYSGIIEVLGLPTRPRLKNAAHIDPSEASATPSPEEHDRQRSYGARFKEDRKFSLASASLRQALQEMPEITEVHRLTGEDCFILKVVVPSPAHLETIVDAVARHGAVTTALVLRSETPKPIGRALIRRSGG